MSFSAYVKKELSSVPVKTDEIRKAELAGMIHMSAAISMSLGKFALVISTEHMDVVKRALSLLFRIYGIDAELSSREQLPKKTVTYLVKVEEREVVQKILSEIGLSISEEENFKDEMLKEAYVRGAFLGSGSISDPKKIYHMEFVCTSEKNAIFLQKIINDWELKAKRVWRKQNIVVYLKESNHIIELLTRIGAHSSILEMENIRILKEINNNINRAYNCDSANIDRTVKSATEQIESIYKIRKHLGIDSLSPQLKEVAELRIAYPEASLNELAMLSEGLTRSGINHRLRKIKQIADEIMVIQEEK